MSYPDFLLYYRSKSGEELCRMKKELEDEITIYSAQNQGQKGMTRDLRTLNDRLTAITFIENERRVPFGVNIFVGHSSFNRILD